MENHRLFSEIQLERNLTAVRERIARAAVAAGRDPADVELVAVTKTVEPEIVRALHRLGQHRFGENRVDELRRKTLALADMEPAPRFDLIGTLQTNKVRHVVGACSLVHSVDSEKLLRSIHDRALSLGIVQDVLVQVNVSGEESKHGVGPEELGVLLNTGSSLRAGVRVVGLMTMAPNLPKEQVRWVFSRLRSIRDELESSLPDGVQLPQLSMGMSNDFEVAIEEGSTLVRVGSALFEGVF